LNRPRPLGERVEEIPMLARVASVACGAVVAVALAVPSASADTGSITSVAPAFGPVGSSVHLTGTGFTGADDVAFNGVDTTAVSNVTDTDLDVVVPSGATSGPVTVHTPNGTISGPSFTVQLPATATIGRSAAAVAYPATVTLRSVLSAGGSPAAGVPATLQRLAPGPTWLAAAAVRSTAADGSVSWTVRPVIGTVYRVSFASTPHTLAAVSPSTGVGVRPQIVFRPTSVAPELTKLWLGGTAHPARNGHIYLDALVAGQWRHIAAAGVNSRGIYTFVVTLHATGQYVLRVERPTAGGWLASKSPTVRVYVVNRTLRYGMSGPDVYAMQSRLRALHYDVGAVNGWFGYDTLHAVVAFQKVQGLWRDGVVGPQVWRHLARPYIPHLLHPYAGRAIEVDLTHQVLFYAVNGAISRILDSSTGGGYAYVGSDGTTQYAITPTGHFNIVYQMLGWHQAKLGWLYDPAYFNTSGYAIHGETEVPSYPASHGCVRITVPAMNRLHPLLYDGMSVWIYRT
jgi:N-acetylmuramoyl-L-alanine amidase